MENENVVGLVINSIVDNNIDVGIDLFEIGLDNLLDESVLKEIPLVKSIYSIGKTGFAIREKHMLKKTLIFLQKLNSNGLDSDEYEEYRQKLHEKDENLYRELEHVIIYIDRIIDERKSIILANLFYNYISKNLIWEQFLELANIVDNLFLDDLNELKRIYKKRKIVEQDVFNVISLNRLLTQNLVFKVEKFVRNNDGRISMYATDGDYIISSLGISLIELGVNTFK